MRLAAFIRDNSQQIICEWENFAQKLIPEPSSHGSSTLRDHIQRILEFIVKDIESEQIAKSHGEKSRNPEHSAAEIHASLRLNGGFDINQMVAEYRALRASIVKLWSAQRTETTSEDLLDLTRFNEAMDQELTESIGHYMVKLNHSKDVFLGILGHDLRSPLSAACMSAKLTAQIGTLNERQAMLVDANTVTLSIHNEGVPIPKETIGRIFESLTRGGEDDASGHASTHLGLGLYITKEIVISHGGTIGVTSSEKDGTRFTVQLPRLAA